MIAELQISKDHASYAGHFPGFPILPGAVLLDEALHEIARGRALDLLEWQVSSMKFLEPVGPGDPLTLEHTVSNGLIIRFSIRHGSRTVASGLLSSIAAKPGTPDGA